MKITSPSSSHERLKLIFLDEGGSMPLHAQLRNSLRRLIQEHFKDQERFVTENELASFLKLSPGTVRRALNDLATEGLLKRRPAIGTVVCKPEKPNSLKYLAVVVPDYSSGLIAEYLNRISLCAAQAGAQLLIYHTHQGEHLQSVYQQIRFPADEGGVILLSNAPTAMHELNRALQERGYLTVNIDTLVRGYVGHYVGVCNETGIEHGLTHLMERGHRRIALLVAEPEENENILRRVARFQAFCKKKKLKEARVVSSHTRCWEDSGDKAEEVMPSLWEASQRPTAVFAVSDGSAFRVLRWFACRGISVPDEVSVLGFDGQQAGTLLHPPLSTVAQPLSEIVGSAFRLLQERPESPEQCFHEPRLLLRESTGNCPI